MNIFNRIKQISDELQTLKSRVNTIVTPAGKFIVTANNIVGGIWSHNHSNTAGGGKVEYNPALPSTWIGNQDPGDVWAALDQLALRVKSLEEVAVGIPPITYPASTMLFNGIEE